MTIRAFNGKITKSASLSASIRVKDYKLLLLTKTTATISMWISQTINGKESGDYVEDVDVPVGTAVTEWYEKGEEEGKKEWRPDNISTNNEKAWVYVLNSAGDTVGGPYLASGIYNAGAASVKLQERTATYTTNGTKYLFPGTGHSGMSKATLTVNVSSSSGGGGCFAAGSPVRLADGTEMPIEDLKLGMVVSAYDEENKTMTESEVVCVQMLRRDVEIYDIVFESGKRLTLTDSHPLMTTFGWGAINVDAAVKEHAIDMFNLLVGDEVITADGTDKITQIVARTDLKGSAVYNIDVEPYDNYFVNGILAHNADDAPK